jgi:hypothetical protein
VFAKQTIPRFSNLDVIFGYRRQINNCLESSFKGWKKHPNCALDGPLYFLNSHCKPTLTDIQIGEELTIYYGSQYFREKKMECGCAYKGCFKKNTLVDQVILLKNKTRSRK